MTKGNISSIETMGLVDGPGIRFVVFFQGCRLRCQYCHNPETWKIGKGAIEMSAEELLDQIKKYSNYFGSDGGVTFSGGEPLLQPDFLIEILSLCKKEGIHTCLDTAGVGLGVKEGRYQEILSLVDLVMLDIKAVVNEEYRELVGMENKTYLEFLGLCQKMNKKMWLRQVIVPGINDDEKHVLLLKEMASRLKNIEKIELLPYHSMGEAKYKNLGIPYRLSGVPAMEEDKCKKLEALLK